MPVLSLPIAVSELETQSRDPTTPRASEKAQSRLAEQRFLALRAFRAGAVSCREVSIPVATTVGALMNGRRQPRGASCGGHGGSLIAGGIDASGPERWHDDGTGAVMDGPDPGRDCDGAKGCCRDGCNSDDGNDDGGFSLAERIMLVAEAPGQLGIGGKVWDSAFVLCDYLAKAPASACAVSCISRGKSYPVGTTAAGATNGEKAPVPPDGRGAQSAGGVADEVRVGETPPQDELGQRPTKRALHGARDSYAGDSGRFEKKQGCCAEGAVEGAQATNEVKHLLPSRRNVRGLVDGKRVLELGAGTGLVSVCCALLGASAVVATDFEVCVYVCLCSTKKTTKTYTHSFNLLPSKILFQRRRFF